MMHCHRPPNTPWPKSLMAMLRNNIFMGVWRDFWHANTIKTIEFKKVPAIPTQSRYTGTATKTPWPKYASLAAKRLLLPWLSDIVVRNSWWIGDDETHTRPWWLQAAWNTERVALYEYYVVMAWKRFLYLLALCVGNLVVIELQAKRPIMRRERLMFSVVSLNKLLKNIAVAGKLRRDNVRLTSL